jgi:hypothetical protein
VGLAVGGPAVLSAVAVQKQKRRKNEPAPMDGQEACLCCWRRNLESAETWTCKGDGRCSKNNWALLDHSIEGCELCKP